MKKLVLAVLLIAVAAAAQAQDYYGDGSRINLCTIRGNVATASSEASGDGPAWAPLYPAYGYELRFTKGENDNAWWQVEFPEPYMVGEYQFVYYGNIYSTVSAQVQTSMDGATWTDQTAVLTETNGVSGSFPGGPVEAKFVRLNVLDYQGFPQMIIQVVRLFGPNDPEVSPAISVAQSTWNGGSATCSSATQNTFNCPTVINDFTDGNWPGQSFQPTGKFIINLAKNYAVETVGVASIADNRAARDVEIYTSPDTEGDNWIFATSAIDVPNVTDDGKRKGYFEVDLDAPTPARRVRVDVTKTWGNPQGYMAELYVYAQALEATTVRVTDFAVADATTLNSSYTNERTVNVTAFQATTTNTLTGFLIKQDASDPAADDPNWNPFPQPTYTITGNTGTVTLYAFAKDLEGHISVPKSVTIDFNYNAPVIYDVNFTSAPQGELTITWSTAAKSIGGLAYGPAAPAGSYSDPIFESTYSTNHSITLTGISDTANYKFLLYVNESPTKQLFYPENPNVPAAGEYYADGSQINLCTIRGNKATASSRNGIANYPLYPAHGCEIRFTRGGYDNAWWQVEFPEAYKVQNYWFWCYSNLFTDIQCVLQTSLDGETWTDQADLTFTMDPETQVRFDGKFIGSLDAPVDAKFVRLNFLSYAGFGEMILQGAKLTGPNNPPVSPAISLSQSTWNNGTVDVIDPWRGTITNDNVLLSDLTESNDWNAVWPGESIYPNAPPFTTDSPVGPTECVVTLQKPYLVELVGIASIRDERKPRDVDVYVSEEDTGDNWTLAASARNLPYGSASSDLSYFDIGYHEIFLDQAMMAKRVKVSILRGWRTNLAGPTAPPEARLAELYVYGGVEAAPAGLDGDANGDCKVNIIDLIYIRNRLNQDPASGDNATADANSDGKINIIDLIYVRNRLNTRCE